MANAIYVDEQLLREAEQILEAIGLDASVVAKMALKRVVRDGGISFLVTDIPRIEVQVPAETVAQISAIEESGRINKSVAVNLFRRNGVYTNNNVTFASKNKAGNYYWANPLFDALKQDWYLILNDWKKKELHLFKIPAYTFKDSDLVSRSDNEEKIDLQIAYNDTTFTDGRSKVSFADFLVKSISY
jgi:antitoxin component of RelBE/YafQ-DinJ toxin-antitoxin module